MAPTINLEALTKRQFGYNNYYYDSPWNSWGRWVALVAVILFVIIVLFTLSCINSRRRRRMGLPPRYGTGWLAGKTPYGHNAPQYYNNGPQTYGAPAPPYSPPVENQYTGQTFNSNEGYYGQQNGIELQQPQHAYAPQRGGDPVYDAPQGPPPKKGYNDGVIR
jgi:hypothetical protein